MLDQRRAATRPKEEREQLFIERYRSLLAWAARLTTQEAAEDLVQDAFVQFMLGRTGLEEIENIDGYLRRMLRYMHISRMSRQAQRLHDTTLSIADYDSLSLGWTAIEPSRRMQAIEELHQICSYACARKESSRAGSVLILKSFHEYFPTEIAGILGSTRHCVDQWQRLARGEVKLLMDEPDRLRFVKARAKAEKTEVERFASDCDLMVGLRQMIFRSCQSACPSGDELREIYALGNTEALTTTKLAHIVSCRSCLDAVNSLLGLPLLAQRYQEELCDEKEPPYDSGDGGSSGGGSVELKKRLEHHLRRIREHKPQELRISVNGVLLSSLTISSDLSELDLNLNLDEPIEFVEIFSEQGLQLLFLSVGGAGSEPEQWGWIELSERRTLTAFLRLQDGPSLHVVYKDPVPEAVGDSKTLHAQVLSSPLALVQCAGETVGSNVGTRREVFRLRSWTQRIIGVIKAAIKRPIPETANLNDSSRELADSSGVSFPVLLRQIAPQDRTRAWKRPGFVTVVISAAIVAAFFALKPRLEPTVTATYLLDQASVAEQTTERPIDNVSHRLIHLEERHSPGGAVVSRRRIESWKNHVRGDRAQRVYDETNRLVAGAWQKAGGSRLVYHHGSQIRPQVTPASEAELLLSLEDIWQLEPSAQAFRNLIAEPAATQVQELSTSYILTFDKGRTIGASRLLKATLTLSRSDLHPIEQTLLVERGRELREYRFVEANFELLPSKAVAATVFDVEPELMGGARPTVRSGDWARRDLTASRVPPLSASEPVAASAELEVDVAYLLNQAKADRNEQVALTRNANGSLRVEGIVDDEERKRELLRALAPVSQNPAVEIDIRTTAQALQRPSVAGTVSVRGPEITNDTVAMDRELREYFSKRDAAAKDLDDAVRSFSSRVVNRAYRALFHAIAIKRLVNRFASVDMRTIAPGARSKWLEMLREHASAFERETASLREDIQPIFFAEAALPVTEDIAIQSDADLARAVERLHKLALANNEAVRAAFTISTQSSAAALKSSFMRSSLSAERLARGIRDY